jgi:glucose-1-phosphate adenylyltransferase
MAVDSLVSGGCIISGSSVKGSLVFSNVRVHSFSTIEDSVILPDVVINRHVKLRRCVIDRRCVLPEGFAAGFDPEQDRKRFRVSERGITLITPGMLGQKVFLHR